MKSTIKKILLKLGYKSEPDFIIIGAQKAGTTSLYHILNNHSLIIGSNRKELHYFDNDAWYAENKLSSYHSFFPLPHNLPKNAKLFEATPIYLFHPEVPKRLCEYNPKLKLIIQLRNPATRAFSAWTMYHHHFKKGKNKDLHDPRTFSQVIKEELESIDITTYFDNRIAYVKRGMYHYQIENFLKYFPIDQLLFIEANELKKDSKNTLTKLQSFIGVPYEQLSQIRANQSKTSDIFYYKKTLAELQDFYRPHNEKLYNLVGKNYNWENDVL